MRTVRLFQIAIIILLAIAPFSALAQSGTPEASPSAPGTYVDPAGQFSVPVPTGWTIDAAGSGIVLTAPDDEIAAYILVLTSDTASDAIDRAWTTLLPDHQRAANPDTVAAPPPDGLDEYVVVTDDLGETSGQVAQAIAMRVGDQVHVIIFVGSLDAAVRRNSQIQTIVSGYTITSVTQSTLDPAAARPFTDSSATTLDSLISSALADLHVPGASVAVISGDQIVFSQGYGTTGRDDQPVQSDTQMMIGSVTKSMTTMMMASMVADGLFAWDTKVIDLYPEFVLSDPDLTATIEMQDLVCACTGIPRRDYDFLFNGQDTPEQMIARLAGFAPFAGFGETFQYSNQMVAAAGYIAAHTDHPDLPLDDAYALSLQERVFDPIGMPNSTLNSAEVEASGSNAIPFGLSGLDGYVPMPLSAEAPLLPIAPAGAAWSTAEDMARYLMTQMHDGAGPDGNQVVDRVSIARTHEPRIQINATASYALGWVISSQQGIDVVAHDGNTFGFSSLVTYWPELDLGIVVLANGQVANTFTQAVVDRLWELTFDLTETAQADVDEGAKLFQQQEVQFRQAVTDPPDPAAFAWLPGTYANDLLGDVTLRFSDTGALVIDSGEFTSEVRFVKGTPQPTLILLDPPAAGLMFTVDRAANTLSITDGVNEFVFTKQDTATPVATPE